MNIIHLLNEGIESTITDYNVAQLQKLFNIINRKAFNSELPPITIKFNNTKAVAGSFKYTRSVKQGMIESMEARMITISKFNTFDASIVTGILAHEMIHYKIFHDANTNLPVNARKNSMEQNHGAHFTKISKAASHKIGFDIPGKETQVAGVRDTGKTFNILAFVAKDGKISVMSLAKKVFTDAQSVHADRISATVKMSQYEYVVLGTSTQPNFGKLSAARTFKLKPVLLNGVTLKDIKVIKKILPS